MRHISRMVIVAFLLVALGNATSALSQPQSVPKLSERQLDKASYVELAKKWKEYIEKNGESAEALVNLGMANEYSGEMEAALIAGKRAVEIDPDHPKALAFLAKMLSQYKHEMEEAIKLLERCRTVAPDHEYGLVTLAAIYLQIGELGKSKDVFRTIFNQRIIRRPLQDFAYNMLVGLPHGAVLITNGDNDTFPPLALQAGMDFRNDVIVINRHLLNGEKYVQALFELYPNIKPKGKIEPEENLTLSNTLLKRMVEDQEILVYFATTVDFYDLGFSPEMTIEGINRRSSGKGMTADESARLFFETYRMDSVTDWNFAWDLTPGITHQLSNYVSCMINLAIQDDVSIDTKNRLLEKANDIASFHEMDKMIFIIKSLKKK